MKRITALLLSLAFILPNCLSVANAAKVYNWYCTKAEEGIQPPIPPEMQFITEENGFSVDLYRSDRNQEDKVIYLTFDAGYENGNVGKILDVLKAENVQGAFFVLENLIKREPELVRRMAEEGHTVCNHTATHRDMSQVQNFEEFKAELDRLEVCAREYAGIEISKYFRPPEGKFTEATLRFANELGYKTVFWSLAYADWDNNNQPDPDAATQKLLSRSHNGMVLLLHPTSDTNAKILATLISEYRARGYRFGTLDGLTACH